MGTLAGAAAGQLTINGDEVEGPCNTAKVLQSVDVCDSVVHVVDKVLMFHAVAEAMEEGEGYDTLAGAAAGQLTINGDEVEGPCNTAKVLQSVEVCESVVHVVDK